MGKIDIVLLGYFSNTSKSYLFPPLNQLSEPYLFSDWNHLILKGFVLKLERWQGPPKTNTVNQSEHTLSFKVSWFIQLRKQREFAHSESVNEDLSLSSSKLHTAPLTHLVQVVPPWQIISFVLRLYISQIKPFFFFLDLVIKFCSGALTFPCSSTTKLTF